MCEICNAAAGDLMEFFDKLADKYPADVETYARADHHAKVAVQALATFFDEQDEILAMVTGGKAIVVTPEEAELLKMPTNGTKH
jgi:hypothetical protein